MAGCTGRDSNPGGTANLGAEDLDALGLRVVSGHGSATGDIIFVHGLGGSAWKTWSWDRDPTRCWLPWLAGLADLSSHRILTFGYNAMFRGPETNLEIADFAKDLLLQMLMLPCRRPIIFVAHSMGGLVVKKAFLLGREDRHYASLMANVFGMVFLATPHRGSQDAKVLNFLLRSASLFGPSSKLYVAELDSFSASLRDINDNFTSHCRDLLMASFYETRKTRQLVRRSYVVPKSSAVLGYQNEISASMDADHHTICKFKHANDANFIKLMAVLREWCRKMRTQINTNHLNMLRTMLGVDNPRGSDLGNLLEGNPLSAGTWLLQRQEFIEWAENLQSERRCLWLTGVPGVGKTTLAASVVEHLRSRGLLTLHHFFARGHHTYGTVAYCLRSLAAQFAVSNIEFRNALLESHYDEDLSFISQSEDVINIWRRLCEGILFRMHSIEPIVCVVDGLDEADTPDSLWRLLSSIPHTAPIKVLLSCIPTTTLPDRTDVRSQVYQITSPDTFDDIRAYVENTVASFLIDTQEETRKAIIRKLLDKASGSFLWVKLAVQALRQDWHTEADIQLSLSRVPQGMIPTYCRMLDAIQLNSERSKDIAAGVLAWVTCCRRPLFLSELATALRPQYGCFSHLDTTITDICGQFLILDRSHRRGPRVLLIHGTARDFLLSDHGSRPGFIDQERAHRSIATFCLSYLSRDHWRGYLGSLSARRKSKHTRDMINQLSAAEADHPLLEYATSHWSYHLSKSGHLTSNLEKLLQEFLNSYLLTWIEAVALSSNLPIITRTAWYLKALKLERPAQIDTNDGSLDGDTTQQPDWIQPWATDLVRITSDFGHNLLSSPHSIHKCLAPICPKGSMISDEYRDPRPVAISVAGLSSVGWNACIATLSVPNDDTITQVLTTQALLVALISSRGVIICWRVETLEKIREIDQGEYVTQIAADRFGTRIAAAGAASLRVWSLLSGRQVSIVAKDTDRLVYDLAFSRDGSELVVCFDNYAISWVSIETGRVNRTFLAESQGYVGCPLKMTMSPDVSRVAIVWRGQPPLVWDTSGESCEPIRPQVRLATDSLSNPEQFLWHPDNATLLILCHDCSIVEWRIYDDEQIEHGHIQAKEMALSDDGSLLLSVDYQGTISVWTFPELALLYRVFNNGDPSTYLEFGKNNRRFYDVRGSICTAWEPDAIMFSIHEHRRDEARFLPKQKPSITALSLESRGKYFSCGREDGSIIIHDAGDGRVVRRVYRHGESSSITVLGWSMSTRYLISSDDGGRVIAKRLVTKDEGKWAVFPVLDCYFSSLIEQLLFDGSETRVLVSTRTSDSTWDLQSKEQLRHRDWGTRQSRRWALDPTNPERLLWVDVGTVKVFDWLTLAEVETIKEIQLEPIHPGEVARDTAALPAEENLGPASLSPTSPQDTFPRRVNWISTAPSNEYLVYNSSPDDRKINGASPSSTQVYILPLSAWSTLHPDQNQALEDNHPLVHRKPYPHRPTLFKAAALTTRIRHIIGTFETFLVYVDVDGWVCTQEIWKQHSGRQKSRVDQANYAGGYSRPYTSSPDDDDKEEETGPLYGHVDSDANATRHFFLPRAWISWSEAMGLITVSQQGTLFCPYNGDVVIVKNGIRL